MFSAWFYELNFFSQSMTLLFKMQKTLVTFSLITLMLKLRVLFIFQWRGINSNLFELICLEKNMKKKQNIQRIGFGKFSFSYINERIMLVKHMCIKIALIFMNILLCKSSLNIVHQSIFLDNQISTWRREHLVLLTNKYYFFKSKRFWRMIKGDKKRKIFEKTDIVKSC